MSFPDGIPPATARLRFRLPTKDDAGFYLKMMTEPDYIRFIADYGLKTEEDAAAYITDRSLARFAEFGVGLWVVETRAAGEPIGVCGLVVRKDLDFPDLGFAFLEAYRGAGYGREAGRGVLDFTTRELNLETLCAITHPDNVRSANLLTKLGFKGSGQKHLPEIGSTADYYELALQSLEKRPA